MVKKAENEKKVDEFYKAAMSAGARDNISPRARLEYYPGYCAARRSTAAAGATFYSPSILTCRCSPP
jgi:hypothetical protein